jgi:hypothetical protein
MVHAHRSVRRDRAVDETEPRPAPVLVAETLERLLALPEIEDLELERGMVGLVRQRGEYAPILGNTPPGSVVFNR